jgi:hypothetical protein
VKGRILLLALAIVAAMPAGAAEVTCTRDDFAAVVDEAGDLLRRMTSENTPRFQGELRLLKEQRGWSEEEFLEAARPLVQNERIAAYDDIANGFLANINRLGTGGDSKTPPDCRLLIELRGHLFGLVETMKAKWAYMFARLRSEKAEE